MIYFTLPKFCCLEVLDENVYVNFALYISLRTKIGRREREKEKIFFLWYNKGVCRSIQYITLWTRFLIGSLKRGCVYSYGVICCLLLIIEKKNVHVLTRHSKATKENKCIVSRSMV
jgi:hypothetical protein